MRRPRLHVPGGCYHVTLRGNHRQEIFFSDEDRQLLGHYVAAAREQVGARIHAYCWMTNHIHLLIQVGDIPLGAFVQRIGTRFARAIQARVPTTGHLFQNRYHALLVDVDRYFLALLRYIHLNPVRAGLVDDPADYPWSGHRAYLGMVTDDWLTTDFGLRLFAAEAGAARERYRAFVMQGLGAPRDPQLTKAPRGEPRLLAALRSPSQLRRLSRARGQVAARALAEQAASLSEIARFLDRSASAVARLAERYR